MSFGDDLKAEYKEIERKFDHSVRSGVFELKSRVIEASPVDTGDLKRSFTPPRKIAKYSWIATSSNLIYAPIIGRGRRQVFVNGALKFVGSNKLPYGYEPIVREVSQIIQKDLDGIR